MRFRGHRAKLTTNIGWREFAISVVAILCLANAGFGAEPLARAKVKQATGSIIRQKGKIQTGSSSRIELELPYLAIVRVGSNANFSFTPDYKEMDLGSGTLMASMPKGSGDVILRSGPVAATMAGNGSGTLEMSNVGGNAKLIVLSGKVLASLTKDPNQTKSLRYGQMLDVPAGTTSMPAVVAIKLDVLLKSSALFNMGDFPGKRAVNQNATKQSPPKPFVTGGFDPDWGGSISNTLSIGPPGTAAMIARMEANRAAVPPMLAPNAVPTQSQVLAFEAAGAPVPNSNIRALERRGLSISNSGRIRPAPQPQPPTIPPPNTGGGGSGPPIIIPPIATPAPRPTRPPIIRPPIATPRPTPRPPIAPP